MLRRRAAALLVLLAALVAAPLADARATTAYDFDFVSIDGEAMPLEAYRGQPILLVNTASFCGFTHQYSGLQALWDQYRDRGFVVIGVPSNQFGNQEPGTEAEIKHFCELNYDIEFPMTEKQKVRGPDAHPIYQWLQEQGGDATVPRWNFHKILIAADGSYAGAWPTRVEPLSDEFVAAVEAVLAR